MKELADEFEADQAEAYTRMTKVKAEYAAALAGNDRRAGDHGTNRSEPDMAREGV